MDDLSDDELKGMKEYLESRLGQTNSYGISRTPKPQKDKRVNKAVSLSGDADESLDLSALDEDDLENIQDYWRTVCPPDPEDVEY